MLFVTTLKWKTHLSRDERDAALARKAGWEYPEGLSVIGEWWTASDDMAAVTVAEADSYEPLLEAQLTWGDAFEVQTVPACTPEDGLAWGQQILQRRG